MSVPPQPNGPTSYKEKPFHIERCFQASDEDIKLSQDAEKILLEESSSTSSRLTVEDWTDAYVAAFRLGSPVKYLPDKEETLRTLALLMARTNCPTFNETPKEDLVTNQWKAAHVLVGCLSHDDNTTIHSTTLKTEVDKEIFKPDTDGARKLLAKNGFLVIKTSSETPQLWRTAVTWFLASNRPISVTLDPDTYSKGKRALDSIKHYTETTIELPWHDVFDRLFNQEFDQHFNKISATRPGIAQLLKCAKEFAVHLALLPPTSFIHDFTDGGDDPEVYGFLCPTAATVKWYGAMQAFGTPWHNLYPQGAVNGVQWAVVSLSSRTTTFAWQKRLQGLASREKLKNKYPCDCTELESLAKRLNISSAKDWYHHFIVAFATDQNLFTDEEAICVKMYACSLALSHPSTFGRLCLEDDANPDQIFLPIDVTTAAWMAAALLFGSPWNISAGGSRCEASTTESAEGVIGGNALASLKQTMKGDLLSCLNALLSSTYFAKVFVAGRIAAGLTNTPLSEFALPDTDTNNNAALLWYNGSNTTFPRVEELKNKKYDDIKDGYKQLTDMKDEQNATTASSLGLDGLSLGQLPSYKCFLEFLRCFRQTASDILHMHPGWTKETVMDYFSTKLNQCHTSKKFKGEMDKLRKKHVRDHKQRIQEAKEKAKKEAAQRKRDEEAQAEAKKKQDEEEEDRRKILEAEAQRKRDEEAQAEAKKKQDEDEEERRKISEAEEQRKRDEETQAEAKKKQEEAAEQRKISEARKEDGKEIEGNDKIDRDDESHSHCADEASISDDDSAHVVSGDEPTKKRIRRNLQTLPLRQYKKRNLNHTSSSLVTSPSSTSTEATTSVDERPIRASMGDSLRGDNCTMSNERKMGLVMRLLVILEHEDDIISPRNRWKRTLCDTFDMFSEKNDHTAKCFISLIFNILLHLKQNRGDEEVTRIVLTLGQNNLLDIAAMAAATEDEVKGIVGEHSKLIDASWMIPLAREIIAVHRGVTPVTHPALRRLESVKAVLSEDAIILFFQDMGCSSGLVIDSDSRKTLMAMAMVDVDEDTNPSTSKIDVGNRASEKVAKSLSTWLPRWKWQAVQDNIRTLVELIKFPTSPEKMARTIGKRIREQFVPEEQQILVTMTYRIAAALQVGNEGKDWLNWLRADDDEERRSRHGDDDDKLPGDDDDKLPASVETLTTPHPINNPSIDAVTGGKASLRANPTVILPNDSLWLPPLATSDLELIEQSFSPTKEVGSLNHREKALKTLGPGKQLNDLAIDIWHRLLSAREKERFPHDHLLRSYCFSCFFWTKLMQLGDENPGYNFKAVHTWCTRLPEKTFLTYAHVVFPINKGGGHWVCVIAFFWEKTLTFFDSLGSSGETYLDIIIKVIEDEHERMKHPFDKKAWNLIKCDPEVVPQQANGYDCGVYTCLYADFSVRDKELKFTPEQVTSMRYHIAHAIIKDRAPIWPCEKRFI